MPIRYEETQSSMETYAEQVIAPVLVDYVEWVLENAQSQGIQRLYFLARDGYILKKIAEEICIKRKLSISCRYLYCSRYALRTASYPLLSHEEVLSIVGEGCVRCTTRVLLERSCLTKDQISQIAECCDCRDLDALLREDERHAFIEKLREMPIFWESLQQESQKAYDNAMAYFEQEGLLAGDVTVVDSGWSGSMQRSLGYLLRSKEFSFRLEGFYFGMYQAPRRVEDGIYHTFYFNHHGKISDKAWFNNNLFECMLAAPHGMTVGYEEQCGKMVPLLREKRGSEELELVKAQETGILRYAQGHLSSLSQPTQEDRLSRCRKMLRRCMVHPTVTEVELLGHFQFCDDATEGYFYPLVRAENMRTLNTRLLPMRVLRKLSRGRFFPYHPFVWYCGSVVGAPKWLQPLYRWNEFLWECVRLSR